MVKKLVFFTQTFSLGGAETFNLDLLRQLVQDNGLAVTAFTNHAAYHNQLVQAGMSARHIPVVIDVIGNKKGLIKALFLVPMIWLWYGWQVFSLVRHQQVDVIFMTGFAEKILLSPWAKLFGIPLVWVEFAPLGSVLGKFGGLPGWLYRCVKNMPDRVITSSQYSAYHLQHQLRFKKKQLSVIPCGRVAPPPSLISGSARQRHASPRIPSSRRELSQHTLSQSGPVIVCVSRLEPGKGQDLLLKALPLLKQRSPHVQVRLVGVGDFKPDLEKLVKELGLEQQVSFIGYAPDAWQELAHATICVCPSMWALEGFGMVVIEAMAMGKPVVAFDRGPTPELIQHGQTGLLAKPGDVKNLAEQIDRLLDKPVLAKKIGERAQHVFFKHYTIEKIAAQYYQVLNHVT